MHLCRIIQAGHRLMNSGTNVNFEKTYEMRIPELSDILSAYERIKPFVHRTPVLTSHQLNDHFGCELFFKCENFQKVGAFKFRGATNAVLSLSPQENELWVLSRTHPEIMPLLSLLPPE